MAGLNFGYQLVGNGVAVEGEGKGKGRKEVDGAAQMKAEER